MSRYLLNGLRALLFGAIIGGLAGGILMDDAVIFGAIVGGFCALMLGLRSGMVGRRGDADAYMLMHHHHGSHDGLGLHGDAGFGHDAGGFDGGGFDGGGGDGGI